MSNRLQYLANLNQFYKNRSGLQISPYSSVTATLRPISQFKSYEEIKLPFVISGRLVSANTYKDKSYGNVTLGADALKSSMDSWVGISIYTSHAVYEKVMRGQDVSVNEVVGKITKVEWNEKDQGVDFYAEVYDKQIAYKMAHGVIQFISVGFARDVVVSKGDYYFMNIEPKEASLVFDPRDKKAVFKPVNA